MKNFLMAVLALLTISLSSCSVISGIFKAGAYTAIIAIVIVVIVIGVIIGMLRKK